MRLCWDCLKTLELRNSDLELSEERRELKTVCDGESGGVSSHLAVRYFERSNRTRVCECDDDIVLQLPSSEVESFLLRNSFLIKGVEN